MIVALAEHETTVVEDVALWWFEKALLDVNDGDLEPVLEQAQAQAERFVDCTATAGGVDVHQWLCNQRIVALGPALALAERFVDCTATAGGVDVQTLAMCARRVDPEHWLARITAVGSSSER